MLIKEAKYEDVTVVRKQCVSEAIYGCDECGQELPEYPNEPQRLELTVFEQEQDSRTMHFCSWGCVLKHIPKIDTDYFVSLPHLYYDEGKGKRSAHELINLLSE